MLVNELSVITGGGVRWAGGGVVFSTYEGRIMLQSSIFGLELKYYPLNINLYIP